MASGDKELRDRLCFLLCVLVAECIFPTTHSDSLAPYPSSEIIIHRRLEPEIGKAKKEELSYVVKVAGKEHIIRLKQRNHFLVDNLPVFTYDSEGRKVRSHPHIPTECYYGGYVEGVANSVVALSTCFGLRGFLKIRDLNYGIEPLVGSRTFQHLLYLANKTGVDSTVCSPKAAAPKRQAEEAGRGKANVRFVEDLLYIELYIVVDNLMFRFEGSDESRVANTVMNAVNVVYTHYRHLNIAVFLVGLDIWKERNLIEISRDGRKVINDFNEWNTVHDKEVKRDSTHLCVHQRFDAMPWELFQGSICKPDFAIGIDPYLTKDVVEFADVISHMLGHNLGMVHDGSNCYCDEETNCIMHGSDVKFSMFSNCSAAAVSHLRMKEEVDCMLNIPDPVLISKFQLCGNKVLDIGEECDCGDERQCDQDPCCLPTCTFKAGAVCAHQNCCENCQLAPMGMLCRDSVNQCDLPEYCTGESQWCPADVYKQDGTRCNKEAYCYAKKCLTHHLQCARIFGEGASAAPLSCFKALNMAGDEVGNCGGVGEGEKFVRCHEEDILCGRLHCSNVRRQLNPSTYPQSSVGGVSCWSAKYQPGRGRGDKGAVPDGIACGNGKICLNRTCFPVSVLESECDPAKKCHDKGFCNNRHNCHCHIGWAPPDCQHIGAGGSIDSGTPVHAFTTQLFSIAFKVVIPVLLVGVAIVILLSSKLRSWFNQCSQRISSWRSLP